MGEKNVTGSSVVNGLDRLVKENNNSVGKTGSKMSRGHLRLVLVFESESTTFGRTIFIHINIIANIVP